MFYFWGYEHICSLKVVEFENNSNMIQKTYSVDEFYNNGLDKLG